MALTQIKSTLLAPQAVGWVPLATATPIDGSSEDMNGTGGPFRNVFDATYHIYMVTIVDAVIVDDNKILYMTFYTGGDTEQTSNYGYDTQGYEWDNSSRVSTNSTSAASMQMASELGSGTGEGFGGIVYIFNPTSTSVYTTAQWRTTQYSRSPKLLVNNGAGVWVTGTAVTGVGFPVQSDGGFGAGTFTVYGLSKV